MTTPTSEAIEAAARALHEHNKHSSMAWDDHKQTYRAYATAALSAAYPLMAAEVLRYTAKDFAEGEWVDALIEAENDVETVVAVDEWLNHRAAIIENEATP